MTARRAAALALRAARSFSTSISTKFYHDALALALAAGDDMDIFVRPSEDNSARVVAALEAFGAPLGAHGVTTSHFARKGDAYRFGIAPLNVEVLTQISGVSFDGALQRLSDIRVGRPLHSLHWSCRFDPKQEMRGAPQRPG